MKRRLFGMLIALLVAGGGVAAYEYGVDSKLRTFLATNFSFETDGPLVTWRSRTNPLTEAGIVQWTNHARAQAGVEKKLATSSVLSRIAERRLNDLLAKQYFAHESPSGEKVGDVAGEVGYEYLAIAENLARGGFRGDKDIVEAWMESPGHRENIVNDSFSEIGVAARKGVFQGDEMWIAVQVFGRPQSECSGTEPSRGLDVRIDRFEHDLERLHREIDTLRQKIEKAETAGERGRSYRRLVQEHNELVRVLTEKTGEYEVMVDQYNAQVRRYNECLDTPR